MVSQLPRRRVMVVYGTRPEAVKVAPLVRALAGSPRLRPLVVVTGQHRVMLDQVNALFGIVPDADLDLLTPGQSLTEVTTRALAGVNAVIRRLRPDAVVVQGDTTTALSGALAAFYERVPVVHLEAGLRTADPYSPFPEEVNRRLTTHLAALHLAPTAGNRANLLGEGIKPNRIVVTGNTVIDALLQAASRQPGYTDSRVAAAVAAGRRIVLVTAHRRESWGEPMRRLAGAVADVARRHPEVTVVLPLHRNPVVREVMAAELGGVANAVLTEPLPYGEFARLLADCYLVLTDSGGIQEEAPSLGRPVLLARGSTERPEAVDAGTVRLVGTDPAAVRSGLEQLLTDRAAYARMARAVNPYGDGRAADRCRAAIADLLGVGERLPEFVGPDLSRT